MRPRIADLGPPRASVGRRARRADVDDVVVVLDAGVARKRRRVHVQRAEQSAWILLANFLWASLKGEAHRCEEGNNGDDAASV